MGRRYEQLSPEDRCTIARMRESGKTVRQIAASMDRAAGAISWKQEGTAGGAARLRRRSGPVARRRVSRLMRRAVPGNRKMSRL
ncbi:MAG: helix-turn-helix domain-containing protein [Candidatus Dadabacteria bacterium]|nr:helix-turn-helix domain-containing protein [Candidatus Dadabacteria bacterium]